MLAGLGTGQVSRWRDGECRGVRTVGESRSARGGLALLLALVPWHGGHPGPEHNRALPNTKIAPGAAVAAVDWGRGLLLGRAARPGRPAAGRLDARPHGARARRRGAAQGGRRPAPGDAALLAARPAPASGTSRSGSSTRSEITAGEAVLAEDRRRPRSLEIHGRPRYELPRPLLGPRRRTPAPIEWNIDRVRAPAGVVELRRPRRGHRRRQHRHRRELRPPALVGQYRGNLGERSLRPQLQLVRPVDVCGNPSLAPVRQQRPRHPHDGHDGRRRRRRRTRSASRPAPGGSRPRAARPTPARRRRCWPPASGCWRRPISTGANPRPDLRPHIVNNSWGGDAATTLVPGDSSTPGSRPASSRSSPTATPARLRQRRLAGRLPEQLRRRRLRHQQRHRGLLQPRRPALAARSSRTSPRRASNVRSQRRRAAATRRSAARRWPRRTWPARSRCIWSAAPALIGDIAAHASAARRAPPSTRRPHLRRHRRRQQRLGRGPARRVRRGRARARAGRPARSPAPSPTPAGRPSPAPGRPSTAPVPTRRTTDRATARTRCRAGRRRTRSTAAAFGYVTAAARRSIVTDGRPRRRRTSPSTPAPSRTP